MKKLIFLGIISFFSVLILFKVAYASFGLPFGGKITSSPGSIKIITLEDSGFVCPDLGITLDIKPVGKSEAGLYPYLIPFGVINKNHGVTPVTGMWILGLYSPTKTPIVCVNDATGVTITVNTIPIILFGTSRI